MRRMSKQRDKLSWRPVPSVEVMFSWSLSLRSVWFEIRHSMLYTAMFAMPIKKISTSKNQTTYDDYWHMGSSFDKVAMNIVGPLSKIEK